MKNSLKTTKVTFVVIMIIGLLVIGLAVYAGFEGTVKKPSKPTGTPAPSPSNAPSVPVNGDATEDAVVMKVDIALKKITVYLPEKDKYLDLSYSGSTDIRTAFGNVISASVLTPASIAEVSYSESENKLLHLYLKNDFWTAEGATDWELTLAQSMIRIGDKNYRISKDVATVGPDGPFDLSQLGATDVINISGKNGRVYVVELVLGHGTLYVMNEKNFVGGSLFVDNVFAGQITEGMAMSMREGTYEISFSKGDLNGKEEVTINRNGTAVINLEPYEQISTDYGYVDFRIKPADAALYIDNFYYDHTEPVRLAYGTHSVEVAKQGYVTWSGTITVGTETMKQPIELAEQFAPTPTPTPVDEPEITGTDEPVDSPTPTETLIPTPVDPTPTPVKEPEEGEVSVTFIWFPSAVISVDSNYIGTTDASGKLTAKIKYGSHTVSLVRTTIDGQTLPKTYQITINADTPTVLSFPTTGN